MSETVTIKPSIVVCIYEVRCSGCSATLEFGAAADSDNDLIVEVEACKACTEDAMDEARVEAVNAEANKLHPGDAS
jgi:hypothetical protein